MSIFSKLFGKKQEENAEGSVRVGGMEDFMTLIRVYYQAVMASQLGISNINLLPDMAVFKRTLKVPTQNNKLGIAEKSRCRKMLMDIYGLSEGFFKEIDASVKKHCRTVNDVKNYFFMFQGFILTKTTWKDDSIRKTCANIRQYQHALSYSEAWMSEYVYNIVALAKKEPKPKA